ncbi:MAG: OadG family protein [Candidatus Accumulibacter sp.]|jgi:sodium pump decarboxylase gamma subunit|nr:OadG family protein [Accumulibacter sp.]
MENLSWGLQMTVLGMGLVFALLALLWLLLTIVLKLDREEAAAPEEAAVPEVSAEAETEEAETSGPPMIEGLPADLVTAILVAVHRHRQNMRRQAAPLARAVWPGSQLFASRWLAAGRTRQTHDWQPKGK